jgi:hypothetical protein
VPDPDVNDCIVIATPVAFKVEDEKASPAPSEISEGAAAPPELLPNSRALVTFWILA